MEEEEERRSGVSDEERIQQKLCAAEHRVFHQHTSPTGGRACPAGHTPPGGGTAARGGGRHAADTGWGGVYERI